MTPDERQQRVNEIKARLRQALDDLDEQTRLPGEPSLREAVATQARQRLADVAGPCNCE